MILTGDELDRAVAAARRGSRTALSDVLESVRPLVVRYCRARVGAGERHTLSADDVAQEVCMAVMTALPKYADQGRPFMAFVYGIAAHKVADAHRGASRIKSDPVDVLPETMDVGDGPEQMALNADAGRRMNELLSRLPDKQREVLVLRLVMGMSAEETAAAVGSTPGAVRVAQHRALNKLKSEMMKAGEGR
ncbi:sigma-70 family RNA polymerase sigma factor [Williamsia sp. CHRR-6]|uniref:sigma-70 family RNA polymerase sigma factor n=1 Tax=Williamsia sp. CHRR-6 TaxID=2835871 RepID=UPI001BDA237D|nr:sigma-70 family RNA polymerase sigma factor [Williamsia sp. CHRR-6]MBT0566758.1 sigma-70 family RNA polymerase sigma factor [Williamsia sp. CHRR-6]